MKIVQCWDDGVSDDIRLIEILRKHGAAATFNLNAAQHTAHRTSGWKFRDIKPVWKLSLGELTAVYEGFTIANHTASHPFLTRIPVSEARRQIREGRDALQQIFGSEVAGFAYPFGDFNPPVKDAVREAGHLYARTVASADRVMPPDDPMEFHPTCHFLDSLFWEKFGRAKASGDVFYFWGHSYEMIGDEEWEDFDRKIARISADPSAVWTNLPDLFTGPAPDVPR